MSVFQKLLHAGEGKRLKAVQAIVPLVSAFEPEVEKLSDEQLIARTGEFKGRVSTGPSPARRNPDPDELELINDALMICSPRCSRPSAKRASVCWSAALRCPGHGRRGAAPRLGRRDEDR